MASRAIGNAFETLIKAFATVRGLAVAWPNLDFTPSSLPYLEMQLATAPNERLTLGNETRFYGSIVVTVVAAKGDGSWSAETLADDLVVHFPVDLKVAAGPSRLRITTKPTARDGIRDGVYWRIPVVIPYEILS